MTGDTNIISSGNQLRINVSAIIILTAFSCLFWGALQYRSPNYFLYNDNVNMYLSCARFNWENIVVNHEIPFINFHEYMGENYLGQGQTSIFSPSLYAAVALSRLFTGDYFWTVDFLMLIHLVIGGAGFYFLLRRLKVPASISVMSSVLWLTFPYLVIISKAWFSVINIFPFLPWNLLLVLMLFDAPRFSTALLLGVVKALSFYTGNAQFVYMMGYTEVFFLVSYFIVSHISLGSTGPGIKVPRFSFSGAWKKLSGFVPLYGFSVVTFLCLAAPQILPLLGTTGDSAFRTESLSMERLLKFSVKPSIFLRSQFGHFGIPIFYNGKSVMYFVGLPLVLLFTFFADRAGEKRNVKCAIALLITASLAFFLGTGLYRYFLFLPFFDHFRWIFKHFLFFLFFFSVLIALLAHSFSGDNGAAWKKSAVYFIFILSIIMNFYLNAYYGSGDRSTLGPWRVEAGEPDPFEGIIQKNAGRVMTVGFFEDFGNGKVLNHLNSFEYLLFGAPTFWKYYHVNGYNPLVTEANFHGGLGNYQFSFQFINYVDITKMDEYLEHFSRWAGRYLITYNRQNVREEIARYPQLALIHSSDDKLVYENTGAYPMVYLGSDTRRPVAYEIGVNTIKVRPDNRTDDTLFVNVIPLDGYSYRTGDDHAYTDINVRQKTIKERDACFSGGKKIVPCKPGRWTRKGYIEEVEKNIRPVAIKIPAHTGSVELRYRDKYFFYGIYTAIVFILICFTGAGIKSLFKKRSKQNS